MNMKHGTLYKCADPKAIIPIARGSGNCEVVFNNLLDLIETVWVFPRTAIVGIRINAKGLHGSGLSLK